LIWATIIFAAALSLDGFGVGISYGIRKIGIPIKSLLVICISSAFALAISMSAGKLIAILISEQVAETIGGISLILVGTWLLIEAWAHKLEPENGWEHGNNAPLTVLKFSLPSLGLVIKILKEPAKADFDQSGEISTNEAVFLGFALAMDALGAGLGSAMMGFSPVFTPLILVIVKFCLINIGLYLGKSSVLKPKNKLSLLPGAIILCLGAIKMF
jgi:putative sporulation protein YtaF